jgi:hypothetical protein
MVLWKSDSKVGLILVAVIFNKEKIDGLSITDKQHYQSLNANTTRSVPLLVLWILWEKDLENLGNLQMC